MSAGAIAPGAACAAFPSTGRSTGRSPAPASPMATCSAPTAMSSATRSTGSTTSSATACRSRPLSDGAPEGVQILALGMATLVEEGQGLPPGGFLVDDDARFTPSTLYHDDGPEAVDKVKRGSGMIVNFSRGKGEVFHAGSCEWVAGLIRRDAMVELVTKNVLDRYAAAVRQGTSRMTAHASARATRRAQRASRRICSMSRGCAGRWSTAPRASMSGREDGRRFIDGSSGPVAVNIGYGNENVLAAMKRQMEQDHLRLPPAFRERAGRGAGARSRGPHAGRARPHLLRLGRVGGGRNPASSSRGNGRSPRARRSAGK